jgi:hypothetical protein
VIINTLNIMYRLSVWLIVFAFVFNGAAFYAAADLSARPLVASQDHRPSAACTPSAHRAVATAIDHGQADHHAGFKCCHTCNVTTVLTDAVAIAEPYSYNVVTFAMVQHELVGHLLALDPGIPKATLRT